jgi:alkanesulfonate monooxygenase SsuD/methylene tetrahydromethanopterin reductase-like flavin-dependent oxidoreductase (luciferase family)
MFDGALEQHGRPRDSSKFMINRMTFVADTTEEAWKAMPFVLANHRVIDMTLLDLEKLVDGAYSVDQKVMDDEPELEEMYRNISFGTPDVVREHIHRYAELGLDVYSSWHNIGQPHEAVCRSMELFATEVMPKFQTRDAGVV